MDEVLLVTASSLTAVFVQFVVRPAVATRFLPLASVLSGMFIVGAYALTGEIEPLRVPLAGLMVGLAASGGFDFATKARKKGQEPN